MPACMFMCVHMLVCGWRTSVTIPWVLATLFLEAGSLIGLRLTNRARLAGQRPRFSASASSVQPPGLWSWSLLGCWEAMRLSALSGYFSMNSF